MPKARTGHRLRAEPQRLTLPMPRTDGALAARLSALPDDAAKGLIHITGSEGKAERLGRMLEAMRPDAEILVLPGWDCFPFDRTSPSRQLMGRRIAVLTALRQPAARPRLLVATPDALLQKVAPPDIFERETLQLALGERLDLDRLGPALERIGYVQDERIDEPGEFALRGQVIDVFPAGSPRPFRIEHEDGNVIKIEAYDPATQRTNAAEEDLPGLFLRPISEAITPPLDDEAPVERPAGIEHRISELYPKLVTVFDLMAGALISQEPRAEDRRAAFLDQVAEAFDARSRLEAGLTRPIKPDRLYLDEATFAAERGAHDLVTFEDDDDPADEAAPVFATAERPNAVFAAFVTEQWEAGRRVVLAAGNDADAATLKRRCETALSRAPFPVAGWPEILAAQKANLLALSVDLSAGFVDPEAGVAVIAAADLLGSRAGSGAQTTDTAALPDDLSEFRLGDAVVHLDHGLGLLEAIEPIQSEVTGASDTIRLRYAGDAVLMAPVDQIDRMWRYGALEKGVSLDRLDGEAWPKRRAKVETEIATSAAKLVRLARVRDDREAPKLVAPRRDYERFVARFPFAETRDQSQAIGAVLADLASGRAMDRLLCGDVGFGKTEVALRAAAACALAGKQVALVAPTTVLVRQHLQIFRRRFADLGIDIGELSRLTSPAETRRVKAGLADGGIRIVIGTHALAGRGVGFADLGLVIIDEEQHFGTAQKAKLRALAGGAHVLTLTATPIPRSFQAALVGLQDLSLLATPPVERRPIRTVLAPFDPVTLREALLQERRRGGQSFVVCPRIEDIEPMAERLRSLTPELELRIAHGKLPAAEIDEVMVGFADGEGDVLLATNIIESGLDVPRANTMMVWRPDRFGLAQLHQLRGRVGRGRQRGTCYLMTDPETDLPDAIHKRLETLVSLDRLGAGFAISARDLDLRGAGDLLGDDQAGHVKLIGPGLYRRMLERALADARGEPVADDAAPELRLGFAGRIPEDYVPEPEIRLNLYAQIAHISEAKETGALVDEIEDRFGPMPEPVRLLMELSRLRDRCRRRGIARLDAGPQAIALTFRDRKHAGALTDAAVQALGGALAWKGERLVWSEPTDEASRLEAVSSLLDRIPAVRN